MSKPAHISIFTKLNSDEGQRKVTYPKMYQHLTLKENVWKSLDKWIMTCIYYENNNFVLFCFINTVHA